MQPDHTQRFTPRVENYQRYRPSYPRELLTLLERECGLAPGARIADVGSGTGLLSQVFVDYGCEVFGVEPNGAMRAAAEDFLAGRPRFHSVDGRAEATKLPDSSIDIVTAGQAFHWFDAEAAGREFRRILKPGGWMVLVWNERRNDPGFQADYEDVIRNYATETNRIDEDAISRMYSHRNWKLTTLGNEQTLDRQGLQGRLASSSYAPLPGTPEYQPLVDALNALFDRYQVDGNVTVLYETLVYVGRG